MVYIRKDNFEFANSNIENGYLKDFLFFEVDDLISFAISLLNKKGYNTIMSCSGHPFQNNGLWVSFEEHYYFKTNLPQGFELFYKDDILFITYEFKSQIDSIDILREITNVNIRFYQWVKKLPNKG
jgi:hypothetical protein